MYGPHCLHARKSGGRKKKLDVPLAKSPLRSPQSRGPAKKQRKKKRKKKRMSKAEEATEKRKQCKMENAAKKAKQERAKVTTWGPGPPSAPAPAPARSPAWHLRHPGTGCTPPWRAITDRVRRASAALEHAQQCVVNVFMQAAMRAGRLEKKGRGPRIGQSNGCRHTFATDPTVGPLHF